MLLFFISYLLVINLIGFWSMRTDKYKAVTHSRRTPERRLFLYAALGGSVGSLWGMHMYRHKTKHASFVLGLPAILLAQIVLVTAGIMFLQLLSTSCDKQDHLHNLSRAGADTRPA